MKRHIVNLVFVTLACATSFATPQVEDFILIDGERFAILNDNPLEELFYSGHKKPEKLCTGPDFTHCDRGYSATFAITDSKLYLVRIEKLLHKKKKLWWKFWKKEENDSFPFEWRELSLSIVFPKAKESVFAEWYTGTLEVPHGKYLQCDLSKYTDIYAKELHIHIENGVIKKKEIIDNSAGAFLQDDRCYIYLDVDPEEMPIWTQENDLRPFAEWTMCVNTNLPTTLPLLSTINEYSDSSEYRKCTVTIDSEVRTVLYDPNNKLVIYYK